MNSMQNARRDYWLKVVYPSICEMLGAGSRASDLDTTQPNADLAAASVGVLGSVSNVFARMK